MSAKRTERLLTLVMLLLSTRRGLTKEELFEEIELYAEASSPAAREKLFDRDKAMLREQGIPLEAFSNDPFFDQDNTVQRYRIDAVKYRLEGIEFTPEESTVLSLAARLWDNALLDSSAARALLKLAPGGEDAEAEPSFRPRIQITEPYWQDILRAVVEGRELAFDYRAASTGLLERRTVHPWGLGARFGHWYLVGFDAARQAERYFRLSRIESPPRSLAEAHEAPPGFDMARSLKNLVSSASSDHAVLAVRTGTCNGLRLLPTATIHADADDDDRERLRIEYSDELQFAREIASHGANAVVLEPPALRSRVAGLLAGALSAARQETAQPRFADEPSRSAPRKAAPEERLLRLLGLVPYLFEHPGAAVTDTARVFGVTATQLAKDLELLFVSGPRYYPDGLLDFDLRQGRIYLTNAQNLSAPLKLNMEEACSLLVGVQVLAEIPGAAETTALEGAKAKLIAATGGASRLATSIAAKLTEPALEPALEVIQQALRSGVQVRLSYFVPSRDEITDRIIEPLQVYSRGDLWYVEAWCALAGAVRNFRMDRIGSAQLTTEPITATSSAAPRAAGPASAAYQRSDDDQLVELALSPAAHNLAERYAALASAELADQRRAIRIATGSTRWIPAMVAAYGGDVTVLEPQALRSRTISWLIAAGANYAGEG